MQEVTIVYDGKCPICRNYSRLVKLDEELGPVRLVDARKDSPDRQELTDRHFNLDEGMVVRFADKTYFGADAIHFLAQVNGRSDFLNRLHFLLFRSERVSSILYPVLRAGRNFLLWVLDVPQINNLKEKNHNG